MTTASLRNLTPHDVVVLGPDGSVLLTLPSSGLARCAEELETCGSLRVGVADVPLARTAYGVVTGLPPRRDGVRYVVSRIVQDACPERDDLLTPVGQQITTTGVRACRALSPRWG